MNKRFRCTHSQSKNCLEMQFNWWLQIRYTNGAYSLCSQLIYSERKVVCIYNFATERYFFFLAEIGRNSDMFDFRYENPVKSQINHFDFQLNHSHTMLPIYALSVRAIRQRWNKNAKKRMQRRELLNSLL